MYTISDLERSTGLTENQIRDRLGLLSPILGDDIHRGARGKILVGDRVLATLRRLVELEREGLSPKVAQSQVVAELGNNGTNGNSHSADPWRRLIEEKDARIADLQNQIARLTEEHNWLRSQLETALAKLPSLPAPPSPPRRSWWRRLLEK
jgi:hypothetical protein